MDFNLIAEASADVPMFVVILEVTFGLGMLIFIHELGHFLVAKACGVKCEKFYLGFDIGGYKLWSFRRGETEYGIGVLPLGGYVKMLGQDDNPSRLAEERERSTMPEAAAAGAPEPQPAPPPLDPRSYLAKSVPQRMAIISAGVIMNMILAVFMATAAYWIGVRDVTCGVSGVVPGSAAWRADLRPGDRIRKIGDSQGNGQLLFSDLKEAVAVSDPDEGVHFQVERPGEEKLLDIWIKPDPAAKTGGGMPTIGAVPPMATTLAFDPEPAAAKAEPKLLAKDTILAVNDDAVDSYAKLHAQFAAHPSDPLRLTVERPAKPGDKAAAEAERLDVTLAPRPVRTLGLVMRMGEITAVQDNSPAKEAGIQDGDTIVEIDGQPASEIDPMALAEQLRGRGGEQIVIKLSRPGDKTPQEIEVRATLRNPNWYDFALRPTSPMSVPALGIAYKVDNIVERVEPESSAAAATWAPTTPAAVNDFVAALAAGDPSKALRVSQGAKVIAAQIIPANEKDREEEAKRSRSFDFADGKASWPFFFARIQSLLPESKVRLLLDDGRTAELKPIDAAARFNLDRGLLFDYERVRVQVDSIGQAFAMGARKTGDSALLVVSFLRALVTRQVSADNLGGVGTIAVVAGDSAKGGLSQLLMFLTILSANLAVINILPIPVLDGGHMVFLAWEGIAGKPPNERIQGPLTWLGLAFILFLMIYVNGLDIARLVTWLTGG